nr:CFEM domain containing integral membrane protein [Colletotrichum truncatum]KAF6791538.1 CFEM domain containing integral membrane protein [Colletotrichum truncatum]
MCRGYPVQTERRDFCRVFLTAVPLFTIVIILLRCAARRIAKLKLWWDDWTALVAMVSFLSEKSDTKYTELGFGLHFWNIAPGNAKPILQLFYVTQMTYILMQIAAKSSICFLYMRIFVTPWFRKAVICLIAIILSQHILFLFLILFQCIPIQSIWDKYISGRCLNLTAIGYAGGSFTVAYDVILITLPIPELLKLNLSLRKKIISVLMLALGSFATVASMIRLKYMVSFANTFDATWDNVDVVIWSCLEMNLVIICGSLPALHPLFRAIAKLFRSVSPFSGGILGSKNQGLEKTGEPSQSQDPNHQSPC